MSMVFRRLLAGCVALTAVGTMFADNPPVAHTGGFGEPTCLQCHFDGDLNDPGGFVALSGLPEAYAPGESYRLTVRLSRADLQRGGFQMAARFNGNGVEGKQGGTFEPESDRAAVDREKGVEYVHHTASGTALTAPDSVRWDLVWVAPDTASAPVVFHLSANASNGDESQFGDYVYAVEVTTRVRE